MSESFDKWKAAAEKLTSEQRVKVIGLLYGLADGCSFAGSRPWKDPDCGKDNGHGYDCDRCAAAKILHELGLTTSSEDSQARWEERKRHEPPKKVKSGKKLPKLKRIRWAGGEKPDYDLVGYLGGKIVCDVTSGVDGWTVKTPTECWAFNGREWVKGPKNAPPRGVMGAVTREQARGFAESLVVTLV